MDPPVTQEGSPEDQAAQDEDSIELPPVSSPLDRGLKDLSDAFGEEE